MSLLNQGDAEMIGGFPRVSGDEPALTEPIPGAVAFSPRERG